MKKIRHHTGSIVTCFVGLVLSAAVWGFIDLPGVNKLGANLIGVAFGGFAPSLLLGIKRNIDGCVQDLEGLEKAIEEMEDEY